jgi:hypothetical protein
MKRDIAIDGKPRKMDIVSTEVILSKACIGTYSIRILFRHTRQFSGNPWLNQKKKKALLWFE